METTCTTPSRKIFNQIQLMINIKPFHANGLKLTRFKKSINLVIENKDIQLSHPLEDVVSPNTESSLTNSILTNLTNQNNRDFSNQIKSVPKVPNQIREDSITSMSTNESLRH